MLSFKQYQRFNEALMGDSMFQFGKPQVLGLVGPSNSIPPTKDKKSKKSKNEDESIVDFDDDDGDSDDDDDDDDVENMVNGLTTFKIGLCGCKNKKANECGCDMKCKKCSKVVKEALLKRIEQTLEENSR